MTTTEIKIKKPKATKQKELVAKTATIKVVKKPRTIKIPKSSLLERPVSTKKENRSVRGPTGVDSKVVLRIRVRAYESKILDSSVKQIMDTAIRHDAVIIGPVPLPTEIKKYTVNRSPFIYKNTREQFEIRVHKRLIDIINPNPKTIEALTNLSLPSGVDIDVKMM